jgi:hypothetical protein
MYVCTHIYAYALHVFWRSHVQACMQHIYLHVHVHIHRNTCLYMCVCVCLYHVRARIHADKIAHVYSVRAQLASDREQNHTSHTVACFYS